MSRLMRPSPECVGINTKSGIAIKMKLPEDISQEILAVMENTEKIKGEGFGDLVKFIMNVHGLLSLYGENFELSEDITTSGKGKEITEQLSSMIAHVCSTLTHMYADARDVSDNDVQEAMKIADTINGIVNEFKRRQNKS